MTRGKAIATVATIWGGGTKAAEHQVDTLVALGILKLDEPKTAQEKAFDIMRRDMGDIHADIVFEKLTAAGLRIVEA